MLAVLNDTNYFFNILANRYNIRMFENNSNKFQKNYIGECYSLRGEYFLLYISVQNGRTSVQVFKIMGNQKACVFQKSYSTVSDKNALSKSTSLFKYLDRILY